VKAEINDPICRHLEEGPEIAARFV